MEMSLLQKTAKMDGLIDELGPPAPRAAALPLPDTPPAELPQTAAGAAEPPLDAAGARKGAGDEEEAARR
jgi:hypothetical protein